MTTLTSPWARLETALHTHTPVQVTYHGLTRLICPHALARRAGRPIVLGYQTGGDTSTGTLDPDPTRRWRCLYLDDITNITPAEPTSPWHTPNNYNPAHPFPFPVTDTQALPA